VHPLHEHGYLLIKSLGLADVLLACPTILGAADRLDANESTSAL